MIAFLQVPRWTGAEMEYARLTFFDVTVLLVIGALACEGGGASVRLWCSRLLWPLGCFFVLLWLSLWQSAYRFEGIQLAIHLSLAALFGYLLVILAPSSEGAKRLQELLWGIATALSIVALLQTHTSWKPMLEFMEGASTFGNVNWMAEALNLCFAPAVLVMLTCRSWSRRLLAAIGVGVLGGAILISECRAVWLSWIVQIVLGGCALWRFRRERVLSMLVRRSNGFVAAFAIGTAVLFPLTRPSSEPAPAGVESAVEKKSGVKHYLDDSIRVRLAAYENTIALIGKSPFFGIGFKAMGDRLPETSPQNRELLFRNLLEIVTHTHNDWLELTAELGLGFIVVAAWVTVICFRRVKLKRSVLGVHEVNASVSAIALLGHSVTMMFGFPTYTAVPPILVALHFSIIERAGLEAGWPGSRWLNLRLPRVLRVLVALLVLGMALGLAAFGRLQFAAQEARISLMIADRQDDHDGVARWAREEGRLMPLRRDWLRDLGAAELLRASRVGPEALSANARAGALQSSEDALRRYLQRSPTSAYGHYLLGMALAARRDFGAAEGSFTTAIRYVPLSANPYQERLKCRLATGNLQGALFDYDVLARIDRVEGDRIATEGAKRLLAAGQFSAAASLLERRLVHEPDNLPVRELLGISLISLPSERERGMTLLRELYTGGRERLPNQVLGEKLLKEVKSEMSGRDL